MKTALKAAGLLVCAFPVALVVGAKDNPDTYPFAKGIIAKLDLPAGRITLKTEHGPRAFDFTPRTYIFRGKEKLTPESSNLATASSSITTPTISATPSSGASKSTCPSRRNERPDAPQIFCFQFNSAGLG
jgi:hypothetical protein